MTKSKEQIDKIISRFSNYISIGEAVFLVGAGISNPHPSHLPLAGQIMHEVLSCLYENSNCLKKFKIPGYKQGLNKERFCNLFSKKIFHELRFESLMQIIYEYVRNIFLLQIFNSKRYNANHQFLAQAIKNNNQILTTNFDTLIEQAYKEREKLEVISSEEQFKKTKQKVWKTHLLFKIHGCINDEDSIRATLMQVGKSGLAFMWEPGKGDILENLVKKHHLIILGYSGMDDFDVMSRLTLIESDKEVLWIHHAPASLQLVTHFKKEFKDYTIQRFMETRNPMIIKGDTSTVVNDLAKKGLGIQFKNPLNDCRCKHKHKYKNFIKNLIQKWEKENPGIVDFIIARLFYISHYRKASLNVYLFLEKYFRKVCDHENYSRTLLNIAGIKEEFGKINEAIKYQELAILFALSNKDFGILCDHLTNLGVLRMREGNHIDAEKNLVSALNISKQIKQWHKYANACSNYGSLLLTLGKYDEAKKLTNKSYKKYKQIGDHSGCAESLTTLAKIVYIQEGNTEEAEILFKMAMEHIRPLRSVDMEIKLLNNLGAIYKRDGKINLAINTYEKAIYLAKKVESKQSLVVAKMGIVAVELSRGNTKKAYEIGQECIIEGQKMKLFDKVAQTAGNIGLALLDEKKPKDALEYFYIAEQDFKKLNFPNELAFTYENIGHCLIQLMKKSEAKDYLNKAHDLYIEIDIKDGAKRIEEILEKLK